MTRRLPVWTTASIAHRHFKKSAGHAVLVIGAWTAIALMMPLWLIDTEGAGVLLLLLFVAIYAFGWLAIAMSWHRRYLYPKAPRLSVTQGFFASLFYGLQLFRVSSLSGAIFTPLIILFVVSDLLTGNIFSEFTKSVTDRDIYTDIGMIAAIVLIPCIFARLSLILPASSLGDDDFGIRASWKHTRGNWLRLLCAWILAAAPLMIPAVLCLGYVNPENLQEMPILTKSLRICGLILIVIAFFNTLSVMSIAYAFLVEKKAVPTPTPMRHEATGAVIRSGGLRS